MQLIVKVWLYRIAVHGRLLEHVKEKKVDIYFHNIDHQNAPTVLTAVGCTVDSRMLHCTHSCM